MNKIERFKLIGTSFLLAVGLAACDKPGPAESTGEKIDQTVKEAGNKIEHAADKVSEAADKAGEKMDEKSAKAGVAVNDAEITAKVKASIFAEPGLKTLQISVDTVNGVVTLSGSVDFLSSSVRAKALAAKVDGVKDVDNQLVLKSIR